MMEHIDNLILDNISKEFKSVKEISTEIVIPYVRVAVRIRQLRKRDEVVFKQSHKQHVKGVKPFLYRTK